MGAHLCLLIGGEVTHTAAQREGSALPLAVLCHVTLEQATPLRLKPAVMTPVGGQSSGVYV